MPTPLGLYLFFVGALLMIVGGHDDLGLGALGLGICFEAAAFFIGGVVPDEESAVVPATPEWEGDDGSR